MTRRDLCLRTGIVFPRSILRRGTQPLLQPVQRLFKSEASYLGDHIASSRFNDSPVSIHLDPKRRNDRCVFESLKIVVNALHRSQKLFCPSHFSSSKTIQGHSSKLANGIEPSQNITPIVCLQFRNCRNALALREGSKGHSLHIFLECDDHA